MLDLNKFRAIGLMAAKQARSRVKEENVSSNEVIDLIHLLNEWKPTNYIANDVVVYNNYPYKVIQTHDSTLNKTWNPKDTPALFSPYHGTDENHALPFAAPTHAGDAYNKDEFMIWADNHIYVCLQNATIYGPDVLPNAWELFD